MTTVPVDARDEIVTATGPIRHMCPFRHEVDEGTVSVSWRVNGATFELHDLAEYLTSFRDLTISHEELTARIYAHLGGWAVNVTTRWVTAGLEVTVSRGRNEGAVA